MEKTSIPNRSNKLHTLSSIYQSTRTLLGKPKRCEISEAETQLAIEFWEAIGAQIPDWQLASQKKVSCAELRRDYIHAHGIALQALASAGAALIAQHPRAWKGKLQAIHDIDWSRANIDAWEGRALISGRVSKSHSSIVLTSNAIKQSVGVKLNEKEEELEDTLKNNQIAA